MRKAIEYYNQAIETDPGYALAYAGLADCYQIRHDLAPHERMPEARSAALKALQLDPSSPRPMSRWRESESSTSGIGLVGSASCDVRSNSILRSAEAYRMLALQLMVRRGSTKPNRRLNKRRNSSRYRLPSARWRRGSHFIVVNMVRQSRCIVVCSSPILTSLKRNERSV